MLRAALELLITIILIMAARAILTNFFRSLTGGPGAAFPRAQQDQGPAAASASRNSPGPAAGNELHKDPVCGTYVAETTQFRRATGGQTFYYCSAACKEKHALVAR